MHNPIRPTKQIRRRNNALTLGVGLSATWEIETVDSTALPAATLRNTVSLAKRNDSRVSCCCRMQYEAIACAGAFSNKKAESFGSRTLWPTSRNRKTSSLTDLKGSRSLAAEFLLIHIDPVRSSSSEHNTATRIVVVTESTTLFSSRRSV